jgi:hypothetical protein
MLLAKDRLPMGPEIPVVIEPGQVKIIRVYLLGEEIEKSKEDNERCFVVFTVISSRAKSYKIFHDITAIGEHKTAAEQLVWKPFKLDKKPLRFIKTPCKKIF